MSKAQSCALDDSHDDGIGTEKESEESKGRSSGKVLSSSRHQPGSGKVGFKSLTALSARDSLERLQKMRRRGDGSRRGLFNRSPCSSADKRARKKFRKRFEKPIVSEVNIRKVTGDKEKLVSVVNPRRLGGNAQGKGKRASSEFAKSSSSRNSHGRESPRSEESTKKSADAEEPTGELLQRLEDLRLAEPRGPGEAAGSAQNPGEANGAIEYGSGDVALDLELGSGDGSCYGDADEETGMACAHIYDSKRRSVQWKREVDVIYYAGDADGGRVVRRENEPLREEADQQARHKKFIQMALTKSLLSNVSACQLRDPWLVVLPK